MCKNILTFINCKCKQIITTYIMDFIATIVITIVASCVDNICNISNVITIFF